MLTRIFATSKPLNFLWVSLFLSVVFTFDWFYVYKNTLDLESIVEFLLTLGMLIFSVLLVDFIVRKNDLSKKNTFVVLLYGSFMAVIPLSTIGAAGVAGHLLLLLALRRLISVRSLKSVKKKLFDAAFWIAIGGLLWYATSGFVFLCFISVLLYARDDYRNWLIPFFAFAAVIIIYLTGFLLIFDRLPDASEFMGWTLDFSAWLRLDTGWTVYFFFALSLLLIFAYWFSYRKLMLIRKRLPLFIVLSTVVCWLVAFLVQPVQTGSLIFLMFPLGVMAARLVERNRKRPITEIVLWSLLLLPFVARFVI